MLTRLTCFDGLPGPTHSYAGLSPGNLAATLSAGGEGNPKAAALESLGKMRLARSLGVSQAILPPHPRPHLGALRRLGLGGNDAEVIARAHALDAGRTLRVCSSASAMWAANAATVAPSPDTADGRVHVTVANLSSMFHRSLEAPTTLRVLSAIFADERHFAVHEPLPPGELFADEGAANHIRLASTRGTLHLFAWGRSSFERAPAPSKHPARQTLEASRAVARLNALPEDSSVFAQQAPTGIDAGAFHTDVLAAGLGPFLMLHEQAFLDLEGVLEALRRRLGPELVVAIAREDELPLREAVASYVFNSELVELASGGLGMIAPREAERSEPARRFLEALPVERIVYTDVSASMKNGGGPACLRLAVPLSEQERAALGARVLVDDALDAELTAWVERHYRDRLSLEDLADPALYFECTTALDELTKILRLGSVFDFQSGLPSEHAGG